MSQIRIESGNFRSLSDPAGENDSADSIRLLFIKQGPCNRNHAKKTLSHITHRPANLAPF